MTHDTESALTHSSNPLFSLRMPAEMSVPGICRGALTPWPQLQAALRELSLDPSFRLAFANSHGSPQAQLIGSPAALQAALAIDPGYLLRPAPPADLYAWFVWVTLRVYQGARTFNLTLQHLPDLFKAAPGTTPADCGAWVKEVLAGPAGLIARARDISREAGTFARHLHSIDGDLEAARSEHTLALQSLAPPAEARHAASMNAYSQAQCSAAESQTPLAHLKLTAAKVTVLSVIENMTKAMDTLTRSWQAMAAQAEAVAARPATDLGNPDFLRSELQLDVATGEWAEFACVIQAFVQGTVVTQRTVR
ncbi:hypothetical protein [Pseudomonas frederiksbergensis]|uniref:Uncharacterized protein n=1 Tax=Pseudomonas frederiksbergensis TaxID=104087 RepID=A0A423KKQ4_9PSED|nr:hypothetical protein [Pseudomonas frederiksbergensis]RON53965.1 hypothetical protein BK665_13780 [Pseudomonas frederiksbergensis]